MNYDELYKCKPGILLKLNKKFFFYIRNENDILQSSSKTCFDKETIILLLRFRKEYYGITCLEFLIRNKIYYTFPTILYDSVDII